MTPRKPTHEQTVARILSFVLKLESGCWEWQGRRDRGGYGRTHFCGARGQLAHRVVYLLLKGPIPSGLDLDHLCTNKPCVNPDHLEPVTNAENQRRRAALRTHCKHGHEYAPENTYIAANGSRACRACNLAAVQRYAARSRATEATA